jgi:hypothetical protein
MSELGHDEALLSWRLITMPFVRAPKRSEEIVSAASETAGEQHTISAMRAFPPSVSCTEAAMPLHFSSIGRYLTAEANVPSVPWEPINGRRECKTTQCWLEWQGVSNSPQM